MEQVLTRQQGELVALERRLVLRVRDALAQSNGAPADLERLASLVHEMDELFLLVVVGEYNSGKSTFINALLGDEVFAMGDLPTTRAISTLSTHPERTPSSGWKKRSRASSCRARTWCSSSRACCSR